MDIPAPDSSYFALDGPYAGREFFLDQTAGAVSARVRVGKWIGRYVLIFHPELGRQYFRWEPDHV